MNKGCLISLAVVLVLFSIFLGVYFYQQNAKDPTVYETSKPEITDIIKKTVATGSIKPRREVLIKPQVSGVVDELYIEEGEIAQKGQKIAKIKLIPSQVSINNAQSQVELTRIRYEEAKRELKRQQEVFSKKLDIESARASYETAQQEEARNRQLFEEGVLSEQDYNRFKRDADMAKAAFDNAELLAGNTLQQFTANVDIAKQEMNAAINNLQLLREGASKNSRQVNNIVVSTVEGMVLDVPVEEGSSVIERNNFNEGTSIAIVADMTSLIFEGKVDESDVGKLKEGMPLELTIGAIEDKKFDATLEFISPKGEEEEGTVKFEVRAAIKPTKDVFLRAGYSANGDIILDRRNQVMALQERDVIFRNDSTFIEIAVGDQEFEQRQIKTGISDGLKIEVLDSNIDTTMQVKVQKQI
ncbi:MAG: HlyD family efflux transporter periplasmic adaptor subunit [Bacteroidota bacterium]